uniref:hypothetical protein n=1 Tax=Bacillus cytotoxicus TaxID=580165 RepID=UPI00203ECABF
MRDLKQKENASAESFFLHSSNLYVKKSKWIYIYSSLKTDKKPFSISCDVQTMRKESGRILL